MEVLSVRRAWFVAVLMGGAWIASGAIAQEAPKKAPATAPVKSSQKPEQTAPGEWIWSPAHTKDQVPEGVCFFRRTFSLAGGETGQMQITCDDRFDVFVNGSHTGSGKSWKTLATIDLSEHLRGGLNAIAVKASNTEGDSAGLVVRLVINGAKSSSQSITSDAAWKTSLKLVPGWEQPGFDDSQWLPARSFGPFGPTAPWANQVAGDGAAQGRFLLSNEFRVEEVISPDETAGLQAIAFNEWGQLLAAREGGPLLLVKDIDHDDLVDTVVTYCDQLKNCQGILALNGQVFAVADGPEGAALYRLSDGDGDDVAESVTALVRFSPGMGEHGPHAPVLGPDGFIYVLVGNHAQIKEAAQPTGPYGEAYEGDLVQPRREDPGGHAVGIAAPGGTVIRTNAEGEFVQVFAGGLRNPYDIAFNRDGDLLTFDADMEWDVGLPWYRPTRLTHVVAGGEYGWRSGWAKFPPYFLDSLPATLDMARGSPAGLETYNHYMFPVRYQNALFACDWSQGRIVVFRHRHAGATYIAKSEVFLEGRPLNATDLAVGPDGWLYFCTGGRGTGGGIYRLVYNGKVPPRPKLEGVMQAVRQPQLTSAWARQKVATIQQEMGAEWEKQLKRVAVDARYAVGDRVRALDLMQLVGPFPKADLLIQISRETHVPLRAKAAWLMGIHTDTAAGVRLVELTSDADATVRRVACESLVRGEYEPPAERLLKLLADTDRFVAFAARRALERLPAETWQASVLGSDNPRIFLNGSVALLARSPSDATIDSIVVRGSDFMQDYMADDDFVDLLRVFQLALVRGKLVGENIPALCDLLSEEYPANEPAGREPRINRELMRLLAHLQVSSVIPRALERLKGSDSMQEKLHAACYVAQIKEGWSAPNKMALLEFFEQSRILPGGQSLAGYIDGIAAEFVSRLSDEERALVINQAARLPNTALLTVATLPQDPGAEMIARLIELDRQLTDAGTPALKRLATGIVAVLGRSADSDAMAYLRETYDTSPERREDLAMGLAQAPDGENWPVLVRSLAIVEGVAAQEVLAQLAKADRRPDEPEPIRQAILCGLRLGDDGSDLAARLLANWTDDEVAPADATGLAALAAWQTWFSENYPDEPAAVPPADSQTARWTYQELLGYLAGPEASQGDASRGATSYVRAQCAKCHRFGSFGEPIGPDLSTVSRRFSRKELLEAVIYPSHVVSDQFASRTLVTTSGRTYTGLVAPSGEQAFVVLQSNGEKVTVLKEDVADNQPSRKSAMPEGLLDSLSLQEIADLFMYLNQSPSPAELTRKPEITTPTASQTD